MLKELMGEMGSEKSKSSSCDEECGALAEEVKSLAESSGMGVAEIISKISAMAGEGEAEESEDEMESEGSPKKALIIAMLKKKSSKMG